MLMMGIYEGDNTDTIMRNTKTLIYVRGEVV
jgi:hypothetical protein